MSKEIPQTLSPGQVVSLRYNGSLLTGVHVTCFNESKSRYEGNVFLTDAAGITHKVPLTFGFGDVALGACAGEPPALPAKYGQECPSCGFSIPFHHPDCDYDYETKAKEG